MLKEKKLKLNKVTVQNLGTLSKNEAQKVNGGSRETVCYKTCGLECTVIFTDFCSRSYCE